MNQPVVFFAWSRQMGHRPKTGNVLKKVDLLHDSAQLVRHLLWAIVDQQTDQHTIMDSIEE